MRRHYLSVMLVNKTLPILAGVGWGWWAAKGGLGPDHTLFWFGVATSCGLVWLLDLVVRDAYHKWKDLQ